MGIAVDYCPMFELIFSAGIIGSCCVFGFIGNTTSLFMLHKTGINGIVTFILQVLAVVDNLVLVLAFMENVIYYGISQYAFDDSTQHNLGSVFIKFIRPLIFMAAAASVWITVLLAVNRYIAVCKPLRARQLCTQKKTYIQISFVIFLSIVANIPRFFQYNLIDGGDHYKAEPSDIGIQSIFDLAYDLIFYNILIIIAPLIFLIYANVSLILELRKATQQLGQAPSRSMIRQSQQDSINRLMIVIILVVVICQIPNRIYRIIMAFEGFSFTDCSKPLYFYSCITTLLLILNSSVNFIIYVWLNRRFRAELKKCCCPQLQSQPDPNEMMTCDTDIQLTQYDISE